MRWVAALVAALAAAGSVGCSRERAVSDEEMRGLQESVGRECSRLPAMGGPFAHEFPLQGDTQSEACKVAVKELMAAHEQRARLGDGGGR